MKIEHRTAQQNSNRTRIKDASAFPRRHAEVYRLDLRPKFSVPAKIVADAFSLTLAWIVCMMFFKLAGRPSPPGVVVGCLATIPVTLLIFARRGLYSALGMHRTEEVKRIVTCIGAVQAGFVGALWLLHTGGGLVPAIALASLSMLLVSLGRLLMMDAISKKWWRWSQSVILIRVGAQPKDLAGLFVPFSQHGSYPIGAGETEYTLAVAPRVAEFGRADAAGMFGRSIRNENYQKLLTSLLTVAKRLIDVLLAMIAGVILLPLIVAIMAAVKLTSPGTIFYGHTRVGRNNTPIRVWKFRTMVQDANVLLAERLAADRSLQIEWEQNHKLQNDPRLTPIGNFLRRYSIDELPQLWNVIKGDMSLVGPRPIIAAEIPKYAEYFADYSKVLPGITGLWQVSGRNETTYQQRVYLDSYYVNNWSMLLDLYIMFRTIKVVVSARGAY